METGGLILITNFLITDIKSKVTEVCFDSHDPGWMDGWIVQNQRSNANDKYR